MKRTFNKTFLLLVLSIFLGGFLFISPAQAQTIDHVPDFSASCPSQPIDYFTNNPQIKRPPLPEISTCAMNTYFNDPWDDVLAYLNGASAGANRADGCCRNNDPGFGDGQSGWWERPVRLVMVTGLGELWVGCEDCGWATDAMGGAEDGFEYIEDMTKGFEAGAGKNSFLTFSDDDLGDSISPLKGCLFLFSTSDEKSFFFPTRTTEEWNSFILKLETSGSELFQNFTLRECGCDDNGICEERFGEGANADDGLEDCSANNECIDAPQTCMDGDITGDEVCDMNHDTGEWNFNGATCASVSPFKQGTLDCNQFGSLACRLATPEGCYPLCGNGFIEPAKDSIPAEECDGTNLGGKTCLDFSGGVGGTLACTGCSYDTSGCTFSSCGNGVCEAGEDSACLADCDGVCSTPAPDNAKLCPGDGRGFGENTDWTLVDECTSTTKCEYTCETGYTILEDDPNLCQKIGFECTGWGGNSSACPDATTNLTQDTPAVFVDVCTGAKCEYNCRIGHKLTLVGEDYRCMPCEGDCTNTCEATLTTGTVSYTPGRITLASRRFMTWQGHVCSETSCADWCDSEPACGGADLCTQSSSEDDTYCYCYVHPTATLTPDTNKPACYTGGTNGGGYATCTQDSPTCCGNGVCDPGEDFNTCACDCQCGDSMLDYGEACDPSASNSSLGSSCTPTWSDTCPNPNPCTYCATTCETAEFNTAGDQNLNCYGNAVCDPDETPATAPCDCGGGTDPANVCGSTIQTVIFYGQQPECLEGTVAGPATINTTTWKWEWSCNDVCGDTANDVACNDLDVVPYWGSYPYCYDATTGVLISTDGTYCNEYLGT